MAYLVVNRAYLSSYIIKIFFLNFTRQPFSGAESVVDDDGHEVASSSTKCTGLETSFDIHQRII